MHCSVISPSEISMYLHKPHGWQNKELSKKKKKKIFREPGCLDGYDLTMWYVWTHSQKFVNSLYVLLGPSLLVLLTHQLSWTDWISIVSVHMLYLHWTEVALKWWGRCRKIQVTTHCASWHTVSLHVLHIHFTLTSHTHHWNFSYTLHR